MQGSEKELWDFYLFIYYFIISLSALNTTVIWMQAATARVMQNSK